MRPTHEIAAELIKLLGALENLGGPTPNSDVLNFLNDLSIESRNLCEQSEQGLSRGEKKKMPLTIHEIACKLKAAFEDDEQFEEELIASQSKLTKAQIIELHHELFQRKKRFPKSITKPLLVDAILKDRIATVRSAP